MSIAIQVVNDKLDKEWVELIITARKMGFTLEEIREFLNLATETSS